MLALDHVLASSYRTAELRTEARRDAEARLARDAAPSPLRVLARRLTR